MKKFLLALMLLSLPVIASSDHCPSAVITVTATATRIDIAPGLERYEEIRCFNDSATPVFFGSETATVYPLCNDATACPDGIVLSIASRNVYVKVASGTVNITCIMLR